jgi:hypothetical protein
MKTLLVIDRATGEVERIRKTDPNYGASIALAAERAGLTPLEALRFLEAGQELATAGFVRKIVVE